MWKQVSLENIEEIAQKIRKTLTKQMILIISGELGVGKTTLIKHMLKDDGYKAISPSFLHMLLYGNNFAHIDAYTFKSKEAFLSMSLEELLEERCIIIEWGELFLKEIKNFDAKIVHIEMKIKKDSRFIKTTNIEY